jgi:predicted RNA-binding Zn-ribbon protein involved in translation (DUF1610 family)
MPGAPAMPAPPPIPAPGPTDRALHHVTEQTRTYPCANCGGQLQFDVATQMLKCPDCGTTREIVEAPGRVVAEQDFQSALASLRASAAAPGGPQLTGEKEVVCQSCGGHTTFTGTLTSTRCPYCATPIQRDDVQDAPSRLPIDGVVPFRIDQPTARASLEKWVSGRWFAPSEFKTYKQTGSFASVYAAYFTYDADTVTRYQGRRGDEYTVTVGSGDNEHTETRVNWTSVSGQVEDVFDDMCVLANDGFDHAKVTALEPWPTDQAKPFSAEYVAGHLCRTYDHDVEACFGEANQRMDRQIEQTVKRDIGGDRQQINQKETAFQSLTYKHLLLPIWLLTVIYAGKPFQVFINGVTGEVQGERPWSTVKIAAATVVALIVVAVLVVLWQHARS